MEKEKRVGVFMDHSKASIVELEENHIILCEIESDFSHESKVEAIKKSEHLMHNKERKMQLSFYQKIIGRLKDATSVLLFGPSTAKDEVRNILKEDKSFNGISIDVLSTDHLTENQQAEFIRKHFTIKNNR